VPKIVHHVRTKTTIKTVWTQAELRAMLHLRKEVSFEWDDDNDGHENKLIAYYEETEDKETELP
jgi:hypothetical protein